MLNFCSLYSGSTGNSLFVESENTRILIDSGVSCKKEEAALNSLNIDPSSLNAIIVTHEHIDHVQSLGTLSKKFNIPVFASKKTWDAMPSQKDKINCINQKTFCTSDYFEIGDLKISPFSTPHDAADSCGFVISNNNTKLSIATDLGHMTNEILSKLEGSKFILLEANYEPEVLKCCSYPYSVKTRISGPTGHLSNNMAGETISHLLNTGLESVMLGHLSKESNFPELAYKTVINQLIENHFNENSLNLSIANRDSVSKFIKIA